MKTTRFFENNAKALLLMVVAATMATTRVNAQISNETQGVGGLVLDSLYTTGSNGARSMKYVYEYTLAIKPKVRWELAYFDDTNHSLDEPRTSGYDAYTYDDQDRQQKQETYTESGGAFHLTHIEEIAEYDTETGLPAVIYTYDVDEQDPDATPQVRQKAVTTKYHGNIGLEEVEVYQMSDGEWMLMGSIYYAYDENGHVAQDVLSLGSIQLVTDYEYDAHGQLIKKVIKEQLDNNGVIFEISSVEMTFVNDYYDDGNLKTSSEYDDSKFIQTSYYFWGNGMITAIRQPESTLETLNRFFDLNGRRLSVKPSQRGIYIINGKKVAIE